MYFVALTLIVLAVWGYWIVLHRRGRAARPDLPPPLTITLFAAIMICLLLITWGNRPNPAYDGTPTAIAIAFDVSLSMAARPDPSQEPGVPARLERGKQPLLQLLRALEMEEESVWLATVVFTTTAQTVSPWSSDPVDVRRIVNDSVTLNAVTRPGTDLTAALREVAHLFDTLPPRYKERSRKIAIVVSDGENTAPASDLSAVTTELRARGVLLVGLQVGFSDRVEGVPQYDENGRFLGFMEVGGVSRTIPDPETMVAIAGTNPAAGLYVHGEDAQAAQKIIELIGRHTSARRADPVEETLTWALWLLTLGLLAALL